LIPAPSPLITQTCCVLPCATQVYSSLSAAAPRNRPTDLRPHLPEAGKPCVPLALHALRLLLASRCPTSPIRSPLPPSPVCVTTNRNKPSPATGTAPRQSKRHRPGSRNRGHHQSCRVGTSSPTEQIVTTAVSLDSGHPDDPRCQLAPKTSFPIILSVFPISP